MAEWIPLQQSDVVWSLDTADLTGGSVTMVNSHLVGTGVAAANSAVGPCALVLPVGTRFRFTPVSFYCQNPNPTPAVPSNAYRAVNPGLTWEDPVNGPVTYWNELPPYPDYMVPWPADVLEIDGWAQPFEMSGVLAAGPDGPRIDLLDFGRYFNVDTQQPLPTNFDFLVEIWGELAPGVTCFWTDRENCTEACTEDPGP